MRRAAGLRDALLWPLMSVAGVYCRAAEKHPFTVGVLTTGLKTSAADLFAQKVIEKREKVDWTRQAAFTAFGFAYLGAFQYYFYTRVLNIVARPITDTMGHIASAPFKTFIDQALHHPFLYFPAFYGLKYILVKGEDPGTAYDRYQDELWSNCTALWTIWVPAQLLNFSCVPTHLQIPYVAAVSFVWTVVLSTMRGAFDDKKAEEIYENVGQIVTDQQGVPELPASDPSHCEHAQLASISAPPSAMMVPSPRERCCYSAGPREAWQQEVSSSGRARADEAAELSARVAWWGAGVGACAHVPTDRGASGAAMHSWENLVWRLRAHGRGRYMHDHDLVVPESKGP